MVAPDVIHAGRFILRLLTALAGFIRYSLVMGFGHPGGCGARRFWDGDALYAVRTDMLISDCASLRTAAASGVLSAGQIRQFRGG